MGVKAKDLRRIGAGERDELLGGELARSYAIGPHDRQTIAYSRQTIGYLGEIFCAKFLARDGDCLTFIVYRSCSVKKEGAVVGARAVVSRNVDPWTVVAGNPAEPIRKREISGLV